MGQRPGSGSLGANRGAADYAYYRLHGAWRLGEALYGAGAERGGAGPSEEASNVLRQARAHATRMEVASLSRRIAETIDGREEGDAATS